MLKPELILSLALGTYTHNKNSTDLEIVWILLTFANFVLIRTLKPRAGSSYFGKSCMDPEFPDSYVIEYSGSLNNSSWRVPNGEVPPDLKFGLSPSMDFFTTSPLKTLSWWVGVKLPPPHTQKKC